MVHHTLRNIKYDELLALLVKYNLYFFFFNIAYPFATETFCMLSKKNFFNLFHFKFFQDMVYLRNSFLHSLNKHVF